MPDTSGLVSFLIEIGTQSCVVSFAVDSVLSTFTDARDGAEYQFVVLGNQVRMAENLKYLPSVVGPGTGSETVPYYLVYGYNGTSVSAAKATANYSTYGVLYNWPAAMAGSASSNNNLSGVQGICPSGWHLPSDDEWAELEGYLGGASVACGKMKEIGLTHWSSPNTGATNESGFTGLPGGWRYYFGNFKNIGYKGHWWSSTALDTDSAWFLTLYSGASGLYWNSIEKYTGYSVRCVRD